jgi:hypothetical protein
LDHGKEVLGELVISGGDPAEVLELAEEALDQIAFAIESLAETGLPFAIGFGGNVRHRALRFDQVANSIGIISLVGKNDGARIKAIEQAERGGSVMGLPRCQAEPDRESLRIDDDVDFCREPASAATETVISTPFFAVAACWCARIEVLSIICISPSCAALMASINRSHTPAFRHRLKRL